MICEQFKKASGKTAWKYVQRYDSVLTVDEYNKALMMWIKEEQIVMKEQ